MATSRVCFGFWCVMAIALCATSAFAQLEQSSWAERERARIAGLLIYTDLDVSFSGTPLKEALEQIGETLGISVIGRYEDSRLGPGIDPEAPVTIAAERTPAYAIIERALAFAEDLDPVTWQIRNGFVEVGTKQRLSAPSARELRTYYIGDLLRMEDGDVIDMFRSRVREVQFELAIELVETILTLVEPESWLPEPEPGYLGNGDELTAQPAPATLNYTAVRRRDTAHIVARGRWATLRFMNWDRFLINAPDFIHRQINGYPRVIRPQQDDSSAADGDESGKEGQRSTERAGLRGVIGGR